ncbi:MAG TPA: adenylate/guanylate cyclase domain-containing protein [Acidobacteriota bacterium]|nr:adenylate/guanylate cyclase domain-containing protein [Acidobacteriota bacterium]
MPDERTQRRLAAILAADVVGYSRLIRADEEGTLAALNKIRADIIDPKIAQHDGRIVKLMGDGMLVEFSSVVDAVRFAAEVQQALAVRNAELPQEQRVEFRVGINLGDVVIDGDDIHGDGVNVAARLEGIAEPGGICVSGSVYEQVRDRLELVFTDMGEQTVKNIDRPVRVWQWQAEGVAAAPFGQAMAPSEKPSIAILPFDNMSGDPEQEYFADGITEDIITELSKFRWLTVIARNSTFVYKGKAADIPQVARDLGVAYVLEGSVRKAGDRVRITAQLIEAPTNEHIWAERYDRQLQDIFDLQDEMTRTIVGMIEPELANRELERARKKPTENLNAWDLYQRGLWHRWRYTPVDIPQAHAYFDEAIALDPDFAAAFAYRSWTIYVEIMLNLVEDRAAAVAAGIKDARRAVELNDRDPLGFCAYGFILNADHDYVRATQQFRRSLQLNPSLAAAHYGLSLSLAFTSADHDEEALRAARMAERLSPNDPMMWTFLNAQGMLLARADDYETALEIFLRGAQYSSALFWIPLGIAACSWELAKKDEARTVIAKACDDFPGLSIAQVTGFIGPAAASFGRYIDALRQSGLPEN